MRKITNFLKLIVEFIISLFLFASLAISVLLNLIKPFEKLMLILLIVIIIGGILLVITIEVTSTDAFCLSCHPYFKKEFYESPHGKADVSCADCHIPDDITGFTKAKLGGLKEAWIYFTEGHPENREDWYKNYKEHWEKIALEENLSVDTCLECHAEGEEKPYMEVEFYGMKIHEQLKVEEQGLSCFDCHYNFVHGIEEWEGNK
ncbi:MULTISPECIES: NapC/NirT family cytochrome c [unclassified Marinitoga]|uniref:NapC/NirT family cytochrome c n=1 Tax=unclassified Marinitoga TaxID=2640159 RepID=UPI000657E4B8|nr:MULTISPECIES: NapC/NirT family cytochrome c [unclassified Marinitoga]KLO23981.1 hypothetical protein X274_05570 [Marinitoga sp. 1155]